LSTERVAKSFAALGAGEVAARLIAFGATLLVARRLGPAAYGVVGVASGIMLYLSQVADSGVELVGVPAVAQTPADAGLIGSATLTYRVAWGACIAFVVTAIGLTILPQPDGAVLAEYALSLPLTAASTRWIYLGLQRPLGVAVARVVGELVALAIVAALVHSTGDIAIVPIAAFVSLALSSLWMLGGLPRLGVRLTVRREWDRCKPLFAKGRHLVTFTLLGLVLFNFDLIFLRFVRGATEAGIYAAAYTFISFASNIIVAYSHSVLPALSSADVAPSDRERVCADAMAQAFAVALPVGVGATLVAGPLIGLVFGDQYRAGAVALQWLALSLPVAALREVTVVGLIASSGERALVRVNAATAVANIVLNVLLVPRYGILGAAIATFFTEFLRLALAHRFAGAHGFRGPAWRRYLKPAAAGAAMWLALRFIETGNLFALIGLGVLVYGGALVLLGALSLGPGMRPRLTV
jgi:O-antigen/teichoic acid export membrane protein